MRGASSPCQLTVAETEPNREKLSGIGKGPLLYSGPRNQPRTISRLENKPRRELRTCPISLDTSPTYVTAAVKTMTNRARSAAAGVVSGAGMDRRCFKHRALMRVPQLGPAQAGRNLGKAVQGAGARLRVVPGAIAHTKEATGFTRLNEVSGPVV